MKISRHSKKLHDPWGNKHGNRFGSMCRYGYMVGQSEISRHWEDGEHGQSVNRQAYAIDKVTYREQSGNRYVRAKRTAEGIRR